MPHNFNKKTDDLIYDKITKKKKQQSMTTTELQATNFRQTHANFGRVKHTCL